MQKSTRLGEARGESTDSLTAETHGHISSTISQTGTALPCSHLITLLTMAKTVTAAYRSIWRHQYDSMHAAQKPKSKLKFLTLDKESNMSTLWRREVFLRT